MLLYTYLCHRSYDRSHNVRPRRNIRQVRGILHTIPVKISVCYSQISLHAFVNVVSQAMQHGALTRYTLQAMSFALAPNNAHICP